MFRRFAGFLSEIRLVFCFVLLFAGELFGILRL